mmetsp:Transcript_16536/g.19548  ORF Transcript_16536/g.19548 Transcript_16536/m.19548 type:complete len:410 (+) Transcript_16536:37-1266(+)
MKKEKKEKINNNNSFDENMKENEIEDDIEDDKCLTFILVDNLKDDRLVELLSYDPIQINMKKQSSQSFQSDELQEAEQYASRVVYYMACHIYKSIKNTLINQLSEHIKKIDQKNKKNVNSYGQKDKDKVKKIKNKKQEEKSSSSLNIHFVGHSFSGSVCSLLCGMIQKTIQTNHILYQTDENQNNNIDGFNNVIANNNNDDVNKEDVQSKSKLTSTCLTVGPVPCINPSSTPMSFLPGTVTSFILGDDFYARYQPFSLKKLENKLLKSYLSKSPSVSYSSQNKKTVFKKIQNNFLMKAINKQTKNTFNNFINNDVVGDDNNDDDENEKDDSVDSVAENHDDVKSVSLVCPGTVYMCKPRSNGEVHVATTKKKGGGFSESYFWKMNDIIISKSMLAHHHLKAYLIAFDMM